jgi:hypothetical protein
VFIDEEALFTIRYRVAAEKANVRLIDGLALRTKSFLRLGAEPTGETRHAGSRPKKEVG